MVHPQQPERVLNGLPALHADQRGDLARFADAHDIVGRLRDLKSLGILPRHPIDEVDLFEYLVRGEALLLRIRRHIDGPEDGPDTTGPQSRDIGVKPILLNGNVRRQE